MVGFLRIVLWTTPYLVACAAGPPHETASIAPPAASASAPTSTETRLDSPPDASDAGSAAPAIETPATLEGTRPCEPAPCETEDGTERPRVDAPPSKEPALEVEVEVDAVHRPDRRPRPEGDVHASTHDEELARWNVGGSSDPAHPSSRSGFHPAARVVIDTAVVDSLPRRARRSLSRRGVLLQSRNRGYWPVRLCYEQELRREDLGSGQLRFRVDIGPAGGVSRTVLQEIAFDERAVAAELSRCVLEAFGALRFSPAPGRRIRVDVSTKLWPGDAPLPSVPPPDADEGSSGPAEQAEPDPRAILAERRARDAMRAFAEAALPHVVPCFEQGRQADPGLWGRLGLWLEVDGSGQVRVLDEHDSRFPAASVRQCVSKALEGLPAPPARSEPEAWVIGFRLHKQPPGDP